MRLLYVCSDYGIALDGVKGASVHLRAITRALAERGHEVSVLAPRGKLPENHPATLLDEAPSPLVDTVHHELRDFLAERELDEGVARELRPLIYSATIVERVIIAAASRPPEAIIERLSLFGHVGLDLARVFHVPYIVEVNAPLTKEASQFRSLNLRTLGGEIERRVLEKADGVAVVSGALAERLALKGVDAGKIRVVPNGVDLREFEGVPARAECRPASIPKDAFVIGFAGSLKPWHGVHVLVAAFAEIAARDAEARLVIVGTGPAEGQIRALVAKLGLEDRVLFTGAVPHEEVPRWLRAMDVAVAPFLPVEDFYFSPIKLFEYMASGACVVASRMGQIAEVIADGVDGLLCRSDDVADLVRQLEHARGDRALRETLGQRAEAKVRQHYTWGHAAQAVDEMIAGIVDCRMSNGEWDQGRANVGCEIGIAHQQRKETGWKAGPPAHKGRGPQ